MRPSLYHGPLLAHCPTAMPAIYILQVPHTSMHLVTNQPYPSTKEYTMAGALHKKCPVEYTLSQVSGKWRIIILKELSQGAVRYAAICRSIPGISPKILIGQLREMEKEDLVIRTIFPEVPPRVEYSLSRAGMSIFSMLSTLRAWGLHAGGSECVECKSCEKCIPRNYRFDPEEKMALDKNKFSGVK